MSSPRGESAKNLFASGFNCAQSVLAAYGPVYGIERTAALRMAGPFGAGFGRTANICGTVSGALMVVGLKFGVTDPGDEEARKNMYAKARDFMNAFYAVHGSIVCKDLLGLDLTKAEDYQEALRRDLFMTRCPEFVVSACDIIDRLIL